MDNSVHLNPPSRGPQNPRPPERRQAKSHRACRSRRTPTNSHPANKARPFPTQTPAFAPPPTRRHPERRQAQLHRACRSRRTPKPPHPTDAPRPFPTQIPPEPSLLEPFITQNTPHKPQRNNNLQLFLTHSLAKTSCQWVPDPARTASLSVSTTCTTKIIGISTLCNLLY
jgi:hypothetical protein